METKEEIKFTLGKTLEELGITKNALSVESKVRPATIADLVNGGSKSINFETLLALLSAINRIGDEKGAARTYGVTDIFTYERGAE